MYRCSECGTEYSVKPDYCDCGNDTFIEIEENIQILESEEEEEEPKPKKKVRKTFDEQYPWFEDFKQSLDPLSVIFFSICIVLSVCLLIFVKPEDTTTTQQTKPKTEKTTIEVANIDSFWNDTPPKETVKKQTIISQAPQPTVIVQQQPQVVQKPKPTQQTVNKPVKNFIQNNVIKKTQPQKTNTAAKTTQNKIASSTKIQQQTKSTQTKNTTNQKQVTQVKQTAPQQTTKQTVQVQQPKPITITQNTPKLNIQTNTQELKSYKNNLRNTLTSKIDFENIYGDGKCTVAFKVDSNGKLTNKSFSKQSSNGTLNDEVYSAIMSTPKYKTPPTEYNGQTLYFSVEFKNGTYKTTLN